MTASAAARTRIRASDLPSLLDRMRRGKATRRQPERAIQVAVANTLRLARLPGVFYTAIPNAGRSLREGARFKAEGVIAGSPDMLVIVNGIPHGLELKAPGGRQSPEQKAVEKAWAAAGGVYAVATGIDEARRLLESWGAIRTGRAA